MIRNVHVDVVIVNWNGGRFLPACLRALAASTWPVRIVVVDNASTDGSPEYLRAEHPEIELVALRENAGYAAAANVSLARGRGPYAMVMNPDVVLASDHLAVLRNRLEADPTIGAAQGKLYRIPPERFALEEPQPGGILDSAGHLVRRNRMVLDRGDGRLDGPEFSGEASVFSVCGAAIFLRRTMLEDLDSHGHYFDEGFFAYKEDIDLCWRARILGWDIRYIPEAVAWHVRAWAGRGLPPKDRVPIHARRHSWKNHYLLMIKNDRLADVLRAFPAIAGWELVRHGYALLRDPAVYGAYIDLARRFPAALRQRREIMRRRRVHPAELRRWFGSAPITRATT